MNDPGVNQEKRLIAPKTFRRDRYIDVSKLSAWGWDWQLEKRLTEADFFRFSRMNLSHAGIPTSKELRDRIDEILRNPLSLPGEADSEPLIRQKARSGASLTGVHTATISDLYHVEARVPKWLRRSATERFWKDAPFLSGGFPQSVAEVVRSSWAAGLVSVDLGLPDSVLKQDFADWLSTIRLTEPELAKRSKNNTPSLQSWTSMQLLPSIDLLLWGRVNGIELTPRDIAVSIHEDARYKEASVRLTTIPLALAIIDRLPRGRAILRNLKARWAREAIEQDTTAMRLRQKKKSRKKPS